MSRRNTFTTAILLPFITSMAAYILTISHLSHPSPMNMNKENPCLLSAIPGTKSMFSSTHFGQSIGFAINRLKADNN
jgi:hypothetical protein